MSRYFNFLFCLLAVCILASSVSGTVAAQSKGGSVLFVAPHRLIIEPHERVDILNVSNNSDEARRYDLTLIDQEMTETGSTRRRKNFRYSIKRLVKFVPKRFSLKPGEKQTVRVMVKRPKKLPDGDYHSHLLFREVPLSIKDKKSLKKGRVTDKKTLSFEIRTLYGVAIPVIVQKGKIIADLEIVKAEFGKNDDDKNVIKINVKRIGNSEASSKLRAEYISADGAESLEIITPQWLRMYREVSVLKRSIILKTDLPENTAGGKIVLYLIKDAKDDSKTVIHEIKL